MPKKTKRQAQQRRRAVPNPSQRPLAPGAKSADSAEASTLLGDEIVESEGVETSPVAGAPPRSGAVEVGRRRIGRIDPGSNAARRAKPVRSGNAVAQFEPLDPEDAAIPFDRVPYVPSDLRRVAVIATLMVLIILVATFIVSHYVK